MDNNWRPSANLKILKTRASLLRHIRDFFYRRNYLEVETPLLGRYTVSEPNLMSFEVCISGSEIIKSGYLQTSPEYYMKRLLAAEKQSIFQICKAFRDEELGQYHNPEFTLLEWYSCGFNHQDLMLELKELIESFFTTRNIKNPWQEITYQSIFEKYLGINPHQASEEVLFDACIPLTGQIASKNLSRDACLDLLLSLKILPDLKSQGCVFIYDFPESQAALSKIRENEDGVRVASRFELIINGLEVANGYHELTDFKEQKERFNRDNLLRKSEGKKEVIADENLLEALQAGMPECAGVAVGLDRLLMIVCGVESLEEVQAFPGNRI